MGLSLIKKISKLTHIISAGDLKWIKAAVFRGVAAGIEHKGVLPHLAPLRTIVDVGANHGQFALVVRHCFPDATIFAFEPLSGPAAVFRKVFAGDARARLFQAAIGPQAAEAVIHVSVADDSSSLLPISGLQERLFPGTGEAATEKIRVGRLGDFVSAEDIKAPALLKLDVQGFELEALRGCEDLLDRFAQVYVECSFVELYTGQALADEVIAWLRERGFRLSGVYNLGYDGRGQAVQGDFLFISTDYTDLHR